MFIYFCGSIRGGRQDAEVYASLIEKLQSYGTVLTEHVGSKDGCVKDEKEMTEKDIHDRDMKWLDQSDVIVAEVTQPSLGVGYELGRAIAMNKKVLCMFRLQAEKKLSAMIRGAEGDSVTVRDYKLAEADEIFSEFLGSKEQKNGNDAAAEKDDDDDLVDDADDAEGDDDDEAEDQ